MTYFWNFGTPSISWKWLKLETSNLALTKNAKLGGVTWKIRSEGVGSRSHDLLLVFWDPLHISGTVKLETSKFGTPIQNADDQ